LRRVLSAAGVEFIRPTRSRASAARSNLVQFGNGIVEAERGEAVEPREGATVAPGKGISSFAIDARCRGAACKGASNGLAAPSVEIADPVGNGTTTLPIGRETGELASGTTL